MALDYFTPIDRLVTDAISLCAEVTGGAAPVVPAEMIQAWSRDSDPLGDIQGRAWGGWIRIVPREIRKQRWSSAEDRYDLAYSIEYGHKGLSRERCNGIASAIDCAIAKLEAGLQADGVTPIVEPTPLRFESCERTNIDREREPIDDPEEWVDAADIVIMAFAARADVAAGTPAPAVTPPTVVSVSAAFDSADTGAAQGRVTDLGGGTRPIEVGVCWATHATPTTDDNKTVIATRVTPGIVAFTFGADACMIDLVPGTTYYARLYATNSAGTGYGEDIQVDYPFATPIRFTYSADNNRLVGFFTRTLTPTTLTNVNGWSAIVPTPWDGFPRFEMCISGFSPPGIVMADKLIIYGGVCDDPYPNDVAVHHTIPSGEFADEWGVPVPAFVCANVTIEEIDDEW